MSNYELIKFSCNEIEFDVNVSPDEDMVWLSKKQISILFNRDRTVISRHIKNIYAEGELDENSTCAKNAHVHLSLRNRQYEEEIFNLDVINPLDTESNTKMAFCSGNGQIPLLAQISHPMRLLLVIHAGQSKSVLMTKQLKNCSN